MDNFQLLLKYVILVSIVSSNVLTEKAATWDSCNCYWGSWTSWSSCSESCRGGWQERSRKVWSTDIPECDGFEKCASNDMGWDYKGCNDICYNGGTIRRSSLYNSYCQCPTGKQGPCCEQTVTCGTPSSISNGRHIGSDFTYGHTVTYACNTNYGMVDPSLSRRRCTEHGYWSGHSPTCLYAKSCNSGPCQNSAACVNLVGGYKCECKQGWAGKNCEIDVQPPVMTGCPMDRHIVVNTLSSNQTWVEPTFSDPHGGNVHVTKNYQTPSFEFPWGIYTVHYFAVKTNGLSVSCTFEISVKPHPCSQLKFPKNGVLACNGWETDYSNICKFYCNNGYTMPAGFKPGHIYICGASGIWLPGETLTECVSIKLMGHDDRPTFGDCVKSEEKQKISEQYITDLKKSAANAVCLGHADTCLPENVKIWC